MWQHMHTDASNAHQLTLQQPVNPLLWCSIADGMSSMEVAWLG